MAWKKKCDASKYSLYKNGFMNSLRKLGKYYSQLDEKPCFILALGKDCCLIVYAYTNETFVVLHPYYKLTYIKISWGDPDKQATEITKGNLAVKDWHNEARKVVEDIVSSLFFLMQDYSANYQSNRCIIITKATYPLSTGLSRLHLQHSARLLLYPNLTSIVKLCFLKMQRKAGPLNCNNTLAQCSGM